MKAVARPSDNAKPTSEEKVQFVANDPVHAQLYQWEIEYHKRRAARANGPATGTGTVRADK